MYVELNAVIVICDIISRLVAIGTRINLLTRSYYTEWIKRAVKQTFSQLTT